MRGQEIELPPVAPEIMRIASERHQKGLMSPWIYQLLSQVTSIWVITVQSFHNAMFGVHMNGYTGRILQRNCRKMTIHGHFSIILLRNSMVKKIGSHNILPYSPNCIKQAPKG